MCAKMRSTCTPASAPSSCTPADSRRDLPVPNLSRTATRSSSRRSEAALLLDAMKASGGAVLKCGNSGSLAGCYEGIWRAVLKSGNAGRLPVKKDALLRLAMCVSMRSEAFKAVGDASSLPSNDKPARGLLFLMKGGQYARQCKNNCTRDSLDAGYIGCRMAVPAGLQVVFLCHAVGCCCQPSCELMPCGGAGSPTLTQKS